MKKNGNLHNAKTAKNDEFYTLLSTIDRELGNYRNGIKNHFEGKVLYLPCDRIDLENPRNSSMFFWHFWELFKVYGLKKLIVTSYNKGGHGQKYVTEVGVTDHIPIGGKLNFVPEELEGDGDFRSEECMKLMKECDIVCTNPPFSLFRDFIAQVVEFGKEFLVIGNMNAITYKEIFPLIKENKMWLGVSWPKEFMTPDGTIQKFGNTCWFTNLDHKRRHDGVIPTECYDPEKYPHYDNYDAIEVSKTNYIPKDWKGVMGVPISFLDKYDPDMFEILDARDCTNVESLKKKSTFLIKDKDGTINGKPTYARILIRNKRPIKSNEYYII